jgi:hypothetical protein
MSATSGVDFEELDLAGDSGAKPNGSDTGGWGAPDMGILQLHRRPPPVLPLEVFGDNWGSWILDAAKAAACPADYVALPLLSSVSTLIGNARWVQAGSGWREPPHLWMGVVGDSGDGKSPGADCLLRDVLPVLERRMIGDFPERHHLWLAAAEADKAAMKRWQQELHTAQKEKKSPPPMPQPTVSDIEPQRPRLRQHDVTVEQVAVVLATAAPKGAVIIRDELVGWLDGMNAYNPAGRAFWLESYGGRSFRVERRKHSSDPIDIQHLVVAVYGGTQPERLAKLIADTDDGLLARIQWGWPDPIPFELGKETPRAAWAVEALDRLRELDLQPGDPPHPILMPLTAEGLPLLKDFAREMETRRAEAGGLLRSAYGKARGTAVRIALVLEWLWWCGQEGLALPPDHIGPKAFTGAAMMVSDYFMPMAARVFGDAAAAPIERTAATLAQWIVKERPAEVHVRHLQRSVRLPGLRSAGQIKKAADALVEADWLRRPTIGFGPHSRVVYSINPRLWDQ